MRANDNNQDITIMRPSQVVNFWWLLLSIGLLMSSPFILGDTTSNFRHLLNFLVWGVTLWKMIVVYCWIYTFDEERGKITIQTGVFSTKMVEVPFYRIKSVKLTKPFTLRIFGMSNISIESSEPYAPQITLYGMPLGEEMVDTIKEHTLYWREEMGVKEQDFHHF